MTVIAPQLALFLLGVVLALTTEFPLRGLGFGLIFGSLLVTVILATAQ